MINVYIVIWSLTVQYLQNNVEGCSELDSSQQDMELTSEGSISIDAPKAEFLSQNTLVSVLLNTAYGTNEPTS